MRSPLRRRGCGTSSRLASTARTTNENLEPLKTLANYMITRCAAVGVKCCGPIPRLHLGLATRRVWAGECSLCAHPAGEAVDGVLFFCSSVAISFFSTSCPQVGPRQAGTLPDVKLKRLPWGGAVPVGHCAGLGCTEPPWKSGMQSLARARLRVPNINIKGTFWDAGVFHALLYSLE